MELHIHRADLGSHAEYSPHSHTGTHICVLESGGFREWDGQREHVCESGDLRVSPGGANHELELSSDGLRAWILQFEDSVAGPSVSHYFDPSAGRMLLQALRRGAGFEVECAAYEIVAHARRSRERVTPLWLTRLRTNLDTTEDPDYSLREVATRVDRHPSHVARSFQDRFGRTVGQHLRARSLWLATHRLREGEESLASIAGALGFYDQAHFSRAFRRKFGISPARYRRVGSRN